MKPPKEFPFTLDGEEYETDDKKLTANEILAFGGLTPSNYYLLEMDGKRPKSYENEGDKVINIKKHQVFVSVFIGPTPVSHGQLSGADLFVDQMTKLGYQVEQLGDGHIAFDYDVEVGKFQGQMFRTGLLIPPSFPLEPPSGPHISPHVHPCGAGGDHPIGGVHPSEDHAPRFKDKFQYWSRPFNGWKESPRNAAAYLAFLRRLWATQ